MFEGDERIVSGEGETSAVGRPLDGHEGPGVTERPDTPAAEHHVAQRKKWVVLVAVNAVLLAGLGVGASLVIKSPSQAAADAKAPQADVLTAPVERRVLKETVVLRGLVSAGQSVEVTPSVAVGEGAGSPVVTKLRTKAGSPVTEGQVLLEVSGRPVFVLKGVLPAYRDLKPGAKGEDVVQLQKALQNLGHRTGGDASGTFGAGTKAALSSFYGSIGYEPMPAQDDPGAVKGAKDAVTGAERALEDARHAWAMEQSRSRPAVGDPSPAPTGNGMKPEESPAPVGKDFASTAALQKAVQRAEEDLAEARKTLSAVQAASGPMLPSGEVVFLKGFPARVDSVTTRVGAQISGKALTVSAGEAVVNAYLQEHQKGLVRAGQQVEVLSESLGTTVKATVRSVADTKETGQSPVAAGDGNAHAEATGREGYLLVVEPSGRLDAQMVGQDVRLTIEAASTNGTALVVPVTAITSGADGKTAVTVFEKAGAQRRVPVRMGTQGDGYVEVVPLSGMQLAAGDEVVTGVRPSGRDTADYGASGSTQ
ncbi:peptidoglycan-binding protein [Streptomyces sp. NPDC057705]|uniref:peptidoglycan-binding protein n=1 Tax=Streptomyces sp. NPDC057705 TaxID=3346222 RepID=UPI0036885ED3